MSENQFAFKDDFNTYLIKYYGTEKEVIIPEGVTVIGEAAFASCFNLQNVTFPSTLNSIKDLAFFNCINLCDISPYTGEIAENAFLGCVSLKRERFILKEMTIKQIESIPLASFYVKDYQRGYRWTKNEIYELLNDIKETTSKYCLQPLIVKQGKLESCKRFIDNTGLHDIINSTPSVAYELIDGQQRLTTLLLILNECCSRLENSSPVNYQIYYELLREIDNYYIEKAGANIREWFDNQNESFSVNEFITTIRENLFFIWYEMKHDSKIVIEDEFRNINDGQTPLTNAELFKALLLNPENALVYPDGHKENIQEKLLEMAFQWDEIEQNLHDKSFWFFISNDECLERTHLDYLFELFAIRLKNLKPGKGTHGSRKVNFDIFTSKLESLDETRDRYSFLAVKAYIEYLDSLGNSRFESVKKVWDEIVEQYERLLSWSSNLKTYHTIGYLIAIENNKHGNNIVPNIIKDLFKDCKDLDLSEIEIYVRKKIADLLKRQIVDENNNNTIFSEKYYDRNPKDIRDFLLFINVWSTFKASEKFPFDRFKNTKDPNTKKTIKWDIEHISARNLKEKITYNELEKIKPWWQKEDIVVGSESESNQRKWDQEEWKKFAIRVNENEPDNHISNLVLLDSNTNRSYGNALFFGKRKEIIDRDKKSSYIPICTKNVFLKYYTESPDFSVAWTHEDKKGYLANILLCIKDIIFDDDIPNTLKEKIDELIKDSIAKENP